MAALENGAGSCAGNFVLYGLAGRAVVSRAAAELRDARVEERGWGLAGGFGAVWIFPHYERRIPQLAVCDSGFDCGIFLWVDVEKDRIDFRVGVGACGRGRAVALFVSNFVSGAGV